jgi:OmpA-OmpF porin, OOP family
MTSLKYYQIFLMILMPGFVIAQEKPVTGNDATFNFIVTSRSGVPRQGEQVFLVSKKTKKIYMASSGADGKGTVVVPPADKYVIYYRHLTDTVKYQEVDVPAGDTRRTFTMTLKYDPPKSFTLKNVFFETGKSTLRKESFPALDELVDALKAKPSLVIEIDGHTDNVGTPGSNQVLSEGRAGAVREYIIQHGISPKRVTAKGFGETRPVADNDTPEGRQQNRRTEVKIISE